MSCSKRLLSGFLSLLLVFPLCLSLASPALADGLSGNASGASVIQSDGTAAAALNGASGGSELSAQKVISDSLDLLKALPDPQKTILWSTGVLFSFVKSKSDPNGKILNKIADMMNKQDDLARQISSIDTRVISGTVSQQINAYLATDAAGLVPVAYDSLIAVDKALSDGSISADEAANDRKSLLIYNITGNAALGTRCPFDDVAYSLGTFLTMDYVTNIPGKSKANLFTLFDEWQKTIYKWEHQGYNARAEFQNNALSQYLTAAMIDKLSLCARIEACTKESDRIYLTGILNKLTEQITSVESMYLSMQVKPRSENVRYYQVPGHEKLLFSGVTRAIIPSDSGLMYPGSVKGLIKHGGSFEYVNTDYWLDYTDSKTVKYSWLKDVYADYGSSQTLFDIFFSPSEGNFKVAFEDPFNKFYINPTEDCLYSVRSEGECALKYGFGVGTDNNVGANAVNKNCALEWNRLLTYGFFSATPISGKNFIKISELDESSPLNTRTEPTVPSGKPAIFDFLVSIENDANGVLDPDEGFTIEDCDPDDLTGVKLNGQLLQKDDDYFIDESPDGGITLRLDDDVYDSLEDGTHIIHVYFAGGHGKLEFKKVSSASKISAVADVPATGDMPRLCFAQP